MAGAFFTPEQLADRWGTTTDAVWRAVDDPEHPLPFVYFGDGKPRRGGRGQRGLYRFRASVVERWEAAREQRFSTRKDEEQEHDQAVVEELGLDKVRGGQRGKRGSRSAAQS